MRPHQGSIEGKENLPRPAGRTLLDAPQDWSVRRQVLTNAGALSWPMPPSTRRTRISAAPSPCTHADARPAQSDPQPPRCLRASQTFRTANFISRITLKLMNNLVHDKRHTENLFYHLLILIYAILAQRGFVQGHLFGWANNRSPDLTSARTTVPAERAARLPSQNHSYELQHYPLPQRQWFSSVNPFL